MTYKNMRLRMSKNKNIFKNIDQAENLGEIRNKKLLSLIDLFSLAVTRWIWLKKV